MITSVRPGPRVRFSFALRETLQFAGSHLLTSLLSSIWGSSSAAAGARAARALLELLFRFLVAERLGTIILSVLVGHTAWHWMTSARQVEPVPVAVSMPRSCRHHRWLMMC